MARFGRVLSAMITPFRADGSLDLDESRRLARHLQSEGHDGLVIAGTTGEAPVLTDDERLSLFAAVIEAVTIPVIARPSWPSDWRCRARRRASSRSSEPSVRNGVIIAERTRPKRAIRNSPRRHGRCLGSG
jgi:hypothetical protein